MIGKYINKIYKQLINLQRVPNFIILIGEDGCGKRTLLKEYFRNKNIKYVEILGNIENIKNLTSLNNTLNDETAYIISGKTLTLQATSSLLKTTEETNNNIHIALLLNSNTQKNIPDTLFSRALTISIGNPDLEDKIEYINFLKGIYDLKEDEIDELIKLNLTFGDLNKLLLTPNNGKDLLNFVKLVKDNLFKVRLVNALNIKNYLAVKDEKNLYPLDLFFNLFINSLGKENISKNLNNFIIFTSTCISKLNNVSINKEMLVINWIIKGRDIYYGIK